MQYDLNMQTPEQLNPTLAPAGAAAELSAARMEEARRRLIVALDMPDLGVALELVDRLENRCQWFKVGLELFAAARVLF